MTASKNAILASAAALLLSACGGGDGGSPQSPSASAPSPTPTPTPTALTSQQAYTIALDLWRNDDLTVHPKGSCAGCHGPDFIDLARIGSTDADIERRALLDGATQEQADALVMAVTDMRTELGFEPTNAREFRPFQPGGAVLPGTSSDPAIASVERDIAFGRQLQTLLPTLSGPTITSLGQAHQARAEMLDLLRGTNAAGANPGLIQLRDLPTGIAYPLWSADFHHGSEEGTFNDWIADIARDASPGRKAEWDGLQDTYLDNPSTENFWRMYHAATEMTEPQLLGECTMTQNNAALACGGAFDFNKNKYLSTLIGQHLIRIGPEGRDAFMQGPLAFAYLDSAPQLTFMLDRKDNFLLPGNPWEIGDRGRVMLSNSNQEGTFRRDLAELGFPEFVLDSIDPLRSVTEEQEALRLSWFWIGFTMDPSFARIHKSNSTKTGEYMIASLLRENMFLHNSFQANMRIIASGTLPEASVQRQGRGIAPLRVTPQMRLHYSYFVGYNRTILRWNGNIPDALRSEQEQLWHTFTANGFRMGMYLYEDELRRGLTEPTDVAFEPIEVHFNHYQPEHMAHDQMLVNNLRGAGAY
ncbi:hypothetical protein [Aurantiacibacter sediminis]|uniref:hypothetical protein n=1 Tax=Aurantiacibacter sediminis TaxID=2793064 RepID=UPI001F37B2DC|nr:hypothetical protein [Aurantiacibacter sediminis]